MASKPSFDLFNHPKQQARALKALIMLDFQKKIHLTPKMISEGGR